MWSRCLLEDRRLNPYRFTRALRFDLGRNRGSDAYGMLDPDVMSHRGWHKRTVPLVRTEMMKTTS
jgi:hypothetical protein